MKIVGVIPARYESSRFPGKPLALIHGKPMIWWVFNRALKVKEIDYVVVATDDERIYDVCKELEIEVVYTSSNIFTGADRVAEVASKIDADIYLNIQGDEPLLEPNAVLQIIDAMRNDNALYYVGLKSKLNNVVEWESPNVVKAIVDNDSYALYFSRSKIPYSNYESAYRVMGIYGYRKDFLLKFKNLGQSSLEIAENGVEMLRAMQAGYKVKLINTKYNSIGVDLPEQIELVEKMISNQDERIN